MVNKQAFITSNNLLEENKYSNKSIKDILDSSFSNDLFHTNSEENNNEEEENFQNIQLNNSEDRQIIFDSWISKPNILNELNVNYFNETETISIDNKSLYNVFTIYSLATQLQIENDALSEINDEQENFILDNNSHMNYMIDNLNISQAYAMNYTTYNDIIGNSLKILSKSINYYNHDLIDDDNQFNELTLENFSIFDKYDNLSESFISLSADYTELETDYNNLNTEYANFLNNNLDNRLKYYEMILFNNSSIILSNNNFRQYINYYTYFEGILNNTIYTLNSKNYNLSLNTEQIDFSNDYNDYNYAYLKIINTDNQPKLNNRFNFIYINFNIDWFWLSQLNSINTIENIIKQNLYYKINNAANDTLINNTKVIVNETDNSNIFKIEILFSEMLSDHIIDNIGIDYIKIDFTELYTLSINFSNYISLMSIEDNQIDYVKLNIMQEDGTNSND